MIDGREKYRDILEFLERKISAAAEKGIEFYPHIETFLEKTELDKTEFALGSRYLHRGFYCPSPDITCAVSNMRRGKLATRITKATKPTQCYMYDTAGRLFLVDTFYPNGASQSEYVIHEENTALGFSYDKFGHLYSVSIEEEFGKEKSYILAYCRQGDEEYQFFNIVYENLRFANGRLETDLYTISELQPPTVVNRWNSVYTIGENGDPCLDSRKLLLCETDFIKK